MSNSQELRTRESKYPKSGTLIKLIKYGELQNSMYVLNIYI